MNELNRDINFDPIETICVGCPLMDLPGMEGKKKKCCKNHKKGKRCKSCPKR